MFRSPRALALVAVSVLVALGCVAAGAWQVKRLGEKRHANSELHRNADTPPVPVGELLGVNRPVDHTVKFRRVTAVGSWDAGGQLLVRKREVRDRPAFLVLTPFRTTDGAALLVVRGSIPADGPANVTPASPAPPGGRLGLTARVYPGETGGLGTGLPTGQVDRIDVPELAARLGIALYGGYGELVGTTPADPALAPPPTPDMSNPAGGAVTPQHLAYVVQWFLFALLALAAPAVFTSMERRRAEGPQARPATRRRRPTVAEQLRQDLAGGPPND